MNENTTYNYNNQIHLEQIKVQGMTFYKIKPDAYGNPRYLVHYNDIGTSYDDAWKIAKAIGGAKYRGHDYGYQGIAFQSYSLEHTATKIKEAVKAIKKANKEAVKAIN